MEHQMKKAYTRRLFNVFQHELQLSSSYYVVRVEGDDLIDVVPYRRCPDLLYGTRTFRVTSSRVEGLYSCTCCQFERDGVLCCHILKIFYALAVRKVPDPYILPRWSVEPVVDSGVEVATNEPLQEAQITDHGKHVIRYSRMCTNFNKIVRPFMADDEGYGIVSKQVSALQSKFVALRKRRVSSVLPGVECEQVDIEQPAAPSPQNKLRKKTCSSTGGGGDPNLSQQANGAYCLN